MDDTSNYVPTIKLSTKEESFDGFSIAIFAGILFVTAVVDLSFLSIT